jgi:hypothetical protein
MLARYRIFDLFRLLHLLDGERNRLVTWLPEDALFEYTCERLQTGPLARVKASLVNKTHEAESHCILVVL